MNQDGIEKIFSDQRTDKADTLGFSVEMLYLRYGKFTKSVMNMQKWIYSNIYRSATIGLDL